MKYVRNYKSFVKDIHKQVPIIEKQIFSDFSNSIWDMSLRSSIFTNDEKEYIKENLISYKIDLLKEEFGIKDFFQTVYDNGKKAGGKLFSTIKEKLLKIKEGMKSLISGVVKFFEAIIKNLFNISQNNVKNITTQFKSPIDKKLVELITQKKIDKEELKSDLSNVKQTTEFLKGKFVSSFNKKVETVDDKVISDAEAEVANIEDELKLESFDILKTFYSVNEEFKVGDMVSYTRDNGEKAEKEIFKIDGDTLTFKDKEGKEFTKGLDDVKPVKGVSDKILDAKDWFMKWFLDMKQTSPPEEGKTKWWMKLVLKVILLLLAPMKALLTTTIKFVSTNATKGLSNFVKALGGPGIFEFTALNAVLIGIPNLLDGPTKIIFSQFGLAQLEEPWNLVFKLFAKLISEISGMDMIIKVFGVICLVLAVEGIVTSYLSKSAEKVEGSEQPVEVTPEKPIEKTNPVK
jgi:hypothetical protein